MSRITVELIDALLSSGSSRQEAETHLKSVPVKDRIQGLASVLTISTTGLEEKHILMTCVLLRRDISTIDGDPLLKDLAVPLLGLLQALPSAACRRQVGYCLAEVCCSLSLASPQDSQAVLQSILTTIMPSCQEAEVVSLRLLANLADRVPTVLCTVAPDLSSVFQSATAALQSSMRPDAFAALVEAICYVAIATEPQSSEVKVEPGSAAAQLGTSSLLPLLPMMQATPSSQQLCLQHLNDAASQSPSLLAGDVAVFDTLTRTCLEIASTDALQVLASLCSVTHVKRRILPSQPSVMELFRTNVIRLCAEFCVNGVDDDTEEWAADPATVMDDVPTWEEDDTALYAESLLCTFLNSLGGTQALPVVLPMVETLLGNNEWKHQRAALSILEQCLYAAPVTFALHVPVAAETALAAATNSPSLRVQFQALVLLGALCEADSDASLRTQYGTRILQVLVRMVQCPCTKVASVACLTLVSYCRGGGNKVDGATLVAPYLQDLLTALVTGPLSWNVAEPGVGAVKVRAIGAVACLAEATEEAFVPFYKQVMPGLLGCTQLPSQGYEMSRLRGVAMEAATIVGQAVSETSRDLYVADAETIMKIAIPHLQADDSSAIPMDELLSACARIASVMGEDYAPFVGVVLPHLLSRVSSPPDVQFSEGDEAGLEATKRDGMVMNDEEGTSSMTVSLPGKGITKVTINTAKILEQAQAARAIYEHAVALGASFGAYAETTMDTLLPLVNFRFSSEVRSTVAQALSATFEAACAHGETSGMAVPQKYLPLLADALSKQIADEDPSDHETMFALADSLSDVLYFVHRVLNNPNSRNILASYTTAQAQPTVQCAMSSMVTCLTRRSKLMLTLQGSDGALSGEDEREEYMQALQGEEEVLTPLIDTVGYNLKFLGAKMLSIFEAHVVPVLAPYLKAGSTVDTRARYAAVCLFDDCVEHCGSAAAAKYGPALMEAVLQGMDDATNGQDEDLKQVSLYGIAQVARYAPGAVPMTHAEPLLDGLMNLANVSKKTTDNEAIVENAVSALASLALIGNAPFAKVASSKKSAIMSIFLDQLPLCFDESEAKICHAGLCDLVENDQSLMNAESQRLLRIIGEVFTGVSEGQELASPETQSRLAEILVQMQRDVPSDQMQKSYNVLSSESQQSINAVMNEYRQSTAARVTP